MAGDLTVEMAANMQRLVGGRCHDGGPARPGSRSFPGRAGWQPFPGFGLAGAITGAGEDRRFRLIEAKSAEPCTAPATPVSVVGAGSPPRSAVRGRHRAPSALGRSGLCAFVVTVAARCVIGVGLFLLLWTCLAGLLGWQSSLVLSGSMSPSFRPGDVAVVRPVATADLGVGQVLLVDDPDRPRELRLHRLADVLDRRLVLQGDANPQADSTRVDPARVHGVVALRVPVVGRPAVWAAEGRHAAVAAAAVLVLLLLAAAGWHRPEDGAERSNVDDGTASEQRLRCSREKPDRVTQHCARQDRRIAKSTI